MDLKGLRIEKGLYQKKVAEWLGVTRRTMRNIECGNTKSIKNYSLKLSEIYKVSENEVIEAFNKKSKNNIIINCEKIYRYNK